MGAGGIRGELASDRQASWQAHGLLITQGLPAPLGAVSNMSEHNQPETAAIHHKLCVCVCALAFHRQSEDILVYGDILVLGLKVICEGLGLVARL